jgi:hypothetical protein
MTLSFIAWIPLHRYDGPDQDSELQLREGLA